MYDLVYFRMEAGLFFKKAIFQCGESTGDISTLVGLGAILTGAGLLRRNCDRATSDISAHVSMWVRIRSRLERKVVRHFLHLAILSLLFWTAESLYGPSSVKNCHSGEFETVRPGARPVSSELQGSSDAGWARVWLEGTLSLVFGEVEGRDLGEKEMSLLVSSESEFISRNESRTTGRDGGARGERRKNRANLVFSIFQLNLY